MTKACSNREFIYSIQCYVVYSGSEVGHVMYSVLGHWWGWVMITGQ